MQVNMTVNGTERKVDVEPRDLLVYFLRDRLALTGTKVGCDSSSCGACTVLIDEKAVKSCTMLTVQADGCSVETIENLADEDRLHPLQQQFHDHHALQCGYCTPGMIMSAVALVNEDLELTDEAIRDAIEGNLCRCTGYENIVKAVRAYLEDARLTGNASTTTTGFGEDA